MEQWLAEWPEHVLAERPLGPLPARLELHEAELEVLRRLQAERRRREWYAGRLAAKDAIARWGRQGPILPDDEGAPWVQDDPELQVSLSHSPRRAVAVAWRDPDRRTGIDLVHAPDGVRVRRVMTRWAKPEEQALLRDGPAWAPGLMWGVREAVAKASRTGMFAFALTEVWVTRLAGDRVDSNWGEVEVRFAARAGELWVAVRMPAALARMARRRAERARGIYDSPPLR